MILNLSNEIKRYPAYPPTLIGPLSLIRNSSSGLITLAKVDSVANRRLAFSRIQDKAAVGKLFTELGPRYQNRPGGYISILKCGFRSGDAAPMAYVGLLDRPEVEAIEIEEDQEES